MIKFIIFYIISIIAYTYEGLIFSDQILILINVVSFITKCFIYVVNYIPSLCLISVFTVLKIVILSLNYKSSFPFMICELLLFFLFCIINISHNTEHSSILALRNTVKVNITIPEIKYSSCKLDIQSCSICLDEFKSNDKVNQTTCNHVFHMKCLNEWYNQNSTCPICRTNLV